jgi:hypothetical protein
MMSSMQAWLFCKVLELPERLWQIPGMLAATSLKFTQDIVAMIDIDTTSVCVVLQGQSSSQQQAISVTQFLSPRAQQKMAKGLMTENYSRMLC